MLSGLFSLAVGTTRDASKLSPLTSSPPFPSPILEILYLLCVERR